MLRYRALRWLRRWGAWLLFLAALAVISVLLLRDVDLGPAWDITKEAAPVAAAAVALLSLMVLALSSWANWRASRHQATLEAWNDWSERSRAARAELTQLIGNGRITAAQGHAIAHTGEVLVDANGNPLTMDQKQTVINSMTQVLNGLERIAAGVEVGIYRRDVLIIVGGTIIKRSYERFEPYIEVRRSMSERDKRQERAFAQLSALVSHVKGYEVDAERLAALRRRS